MYEAYAELPSSLRQGEDQQGRTVRHRTCPCILHPAARQSAKAVTETREGPSRSDAFLLSKLDSEIPPSSAMVWTTATSVRALALLAVASCAAVASAEEGNASGKNREACLPGLFPAN